MRYIVNLLGFGIITLTIAMSVATIVISYQRATSLAHPIRIPITQTLADFGFDNGRDVTFTTSDGLTLRGWFIPPPNTQSPSRTVLFIHGVGGIRLQFIEQAQWLHQQNIAVLLFDLRNHGNSDGDATTMGLLEVQDVIAAFEFLVTQPEVDAQAITLYGHSMGGSTAILAMAQLPAAKALIVDTAYTSLLDVANDGVAAVIGAPLFVGNLILFFAGQMNGEDMLLVRPIDVIASISPRPILFVHGTGDATIPVSHIYALYEAAKEPKTLFIIEGAGHGNTYELGGTRYNEALAAILR